MRSKTLLPLIFSIFFLQFSQAQNYLRVEDPDSWNAINSNQPGWHQWTAHGQFDEVTIIAEPQGLFTEIGFYATISQGPDAWTWQGEFEIIWQFELPGKAIVHDSWLWMDQEIVKADVVDFWTALETYEGIVDRNEDPSFLYQLADNRYEIRIYPLFEGDSRRIKMSFLVPAEWDTQTVVSDLLQNLLQSTDYPPPFVGIGMPVNDIWGTPSLVMDGTTLPMTAIVTGGSGNPLHYLQVDGEEFVSAEKVELVVDAPLTNGETFLSTYSEGGENFYQLAYLPDWGDIIQSAQTPKKELILVDYDPAKSSFSISEVAAQLEAVLSDHCGSSDAINVAVATSNGVHFLSDTWWAFDQQTLADTLYALLAQQNSNDLELLLSEGFAWAQNQGDATQIILMAANDTYVYPPVADDVFLNLQPVIPGGIPFTLLDYQDENVSILFFNNEEYHGNEYFYQLLSGVFDETEIIVFRDENHSYAQALGEIFPPILPPSGFVDYHTTLENGVCYQRYSVGDPEVTAENGGALLQTGKYLGDFPLNISANFITGAGDIWSVSKTIQADEIIPGDTLMREIWYGPHLKNLEAQWDSDDDLQSIIEQSIQERVLTGLTAFLALEPSLGGEPCIDCLFNDGFIPSATSEVFDPLKAVLSITPNPAEEFSTIRLDYPEVLTPGDWNGAVFDAVGRQVADLGNPVSKNGALEWQWSIGEEVKAGIYFCKIRSAYGEITGKIVVL